VSSADLGDTPITSPDGVIVSIISVGGFASNCLVESTSVTLRLTGALASLGQLSATFDPPSAPGVQQLFQAPPPVLTGTSMGTTCTSLRFSDTGSKFADATAPYSGTFQALEPSSDIAGTDVSQRWRLIVSFSSGTNITLECWTITFNLRRAPIG
jgi:hypothetical protein